MPDPIKLSIAKTGIVQPKGILSVNTSVKIPPFDTIKLGKQQWSEFNIDLTDGGTGIYYPNGSSANLESFGRLYTYEAAQRISEGLKSNWRIPSVSDIDVLVDYIGNSSNAGGKLKSEGFDYWNSPNTGATNEYNFNARGSGYRSDNGQYFNLKKFSYIWTTDDYLSVKICMYFDFNLSSIIYDSRTSRPTNYAVSLRFVRDI